MAGLDLELEDCFDCHEATTSADPCNFANIYKMVANFKLL